jgi:hypothetical protein
MGFRFRRSIRLGKGLRINLSKTGASLSVGRRGATVNFGPKGEKFTVGLPGSGLSYSHIISQELPAATHQATPAAIPTIEGAPVAFTQRTTSPLMRRLVWGAVICIFGLLILGALIAA